MQAAIQRRREEMAGSENRAKKKKKKLRDGALKGVIAALSSDPIGGLSAGADLAEGFGLYDG